MKKARTALVDGLRMLSLLRPKNVLFGSGFRPTLSNYVRPKLFYELGEAWGPPGGTTGPPGGTTEPPGGTTEPPDGTTEPPGGTTAPPGVCSPAATV